MPLKNNEENKEYCWRLYLQPENRLIQRFLWNYFFCWNNGQGILFQHSNFLHFLPSFTVNCDKKLFLDCNFCFVAKLNIFFKFFFITISLLYLIWPWSQNLIFHKNPTKKKCFDQQKKTAKSYVVICFANAIEKLMDPEFQNRLIFNNIIIQINMRVDNRRRRLQVSKWGLVWDCSATSWPKWGTVVGCKDCK